MKRPTSWMDYVVVFVVPIAFIGLVSTLWNWNDTTVKVLLELIAWLCFAIVCLVALIGSDMVVAVTPRCQHCGGDLTQGTAWLIHHEGCPNRPHT